MNRSCDQCQPLSINGVGTHEQGCPNDWLHPFTGDAYPKPCTECGFEFVPVSRGQMVCDCADETPEEEWARTIRGSNE